MPTLRIRSVRPLVAVLTLMALTHNAEAQWGPFGNNCHCQPAIAPAAAAPVFSQLAMANPCAVQSVAVNPCPCLQAVQETVYRDVPVTQYRKETRTVKKPVIRTVYEDQKVTAYRQIMVQKTAEVPSVQYQTVSECQQRTVNRSYWRTVRQQVQKGSPCDYDRRPGLLGWMNRQSYEMRMAFTPNYINRRQFVPNVQTVNVPVQRTVAIPTTRTVTYNVAQVEPYETTRKVARAITEYVDQEVTVSVPYTTTKTVAVGTRTRMAYVDPFGGSGTTTASAPTPDRTVEAKVRRKQTSTNNNPQIKLNSYEQPKPSHQAEPPLQRVPQQSSQPDPFGFESGYVEPKSDDTEPTVVGWRPSRKRTPAPNVVNGPELPIVAAN